MRETTYTANSLNQYTGIATPGYEDILGVALATNAVYVNGGVAERKGEYFRRELQVANGSGPLWTNVTVASGGVTNTDGLIVPDDNQTLTYDLDGNLTFDGLWRYEWDAENRLAAMTMTNVAQIANANRLRLEFAYDFQNRRVQKVVKTWTGSVFGNAVTTRFVYDGWNVLTILDSQSSILQSFTWGQDLSGTMDQAGGIGGLLLVTAHGGATTNCFVAYDGNGNVTALVRGGSNPVLARYEYSAYGELLRATGPLARVNPFRFSTKFADHESGLVYYGYRYYSPVVGKWLSRDLVQEQVNPNAYLFLNNNTQSGIDPDGRLVWFLVTMAVGGAIGAVLHEDPWTGFLIGAAAGATGYGAGALVGGLLGSGAVGVTLGSTAANLTSTYTHFVLDNYAHAKQNMWALDTKQALVLTASGGATFLGGAFFGALLAKSGGGVDDAVLDAMIFFASEIGIGAARAFGEGAYQGARGVERIGQDRINQWDLD